MLNFTQTRNGKTKKFGGTKFSRHHFYPFRIFLRFFWPEKFRFSRHIGKHQYIPSYMLFLTSKISWSSEDQKSACGLKSRLLFFSLIFTKFVIIEVKLNKKSIIFGLKQIEFIGTGEPCTYFAEKKSKQKKFKNFTEILNVRIRTDFRALRFFSKVVSVLRHLLLILAYPFPGWMRPFPFYTRVCSFPLFPFYEFSFDANALKTRRR